MTWRVERVNSAIINPYDRWCCAVLAGYFVLKMVGGIGIEPMTSSVSRKRSPTELTAHAAYKKRAPDSSGAHLISIFTRRTR